MKTASFLMICCSTFVWAQKTPLPEIKKPKLDSAQVLKFDLNDLKNRSVYGKSLEQNTYNFPHKMMVKKIENPELYSILEIAPKDNAIAIPNTFQKKNDDLKVEILQPKK